MNIKTFLLNTVRYLVSLPLAIIACQISWSIMLFLWNFWHIVSQPLTSNFLFDIEWIDKIGYYIDKLTFMFFAVPIGVVVLYLTLYYILPSNRYRKFIVIGVALINILLLIKHIIFLSEGFDYLENILMIVMIICVSGYIFDKENGEQDEQHS